MYLNLMNLNIIIITIIYIKILLTAKRHSIYKCQFLYIKNQNKYYNKWLINECLNITNSQYETIGNINDEITKYNEFKINY